MTDRTAFYKAIWAAPDDDLPRLVFADWLDEHGEPDVAIFLRLLCAVRTCPPDIDRLRPLVADLRRAMSKLPPDFVENACPVHPAVVVGPWVDVDHEANQMVLRWLKKNRECDLRGVHRVDDVSHFLGISSQMEERQYDLWRLSLIPERIPATAVCLIEGVLSVVHVWSGVIVLTTRTEYRDFVFRRPGQMPSDVSHRVGSRFSLVAKHFGPDWEPTTHPFSEVCCEDHACCDDEMDQLERTCRKFDPAFEAG